ncbi:MAG: hypothetical protein ACE5FY_06935 [Nitrospiria bacterium]
MKNTALLLLIVHFTLSAYMAVGMGTHLLSHGESANHGMQHKSFICTWMCTASNFIHVNLHQLDQSTIPSFELPVFPSQSGQRLAISAPFIRGPPSFFL